MEKYLIEVTEKQAQVISSALEFYSRIAMGQFAEITGWEFSWGSSLDSHDSKQVVDKILDSAKRLLTDLPPSAYYSIGSDKVPDRFKMAYDLHQVIRYRLACDRDPENDGWNVHKNEPIRYGSEKFATMLPVPSSGE